MGPGRRSVLRIDPSQSEAWPAWSAEVAGRVEAGTDRGAVLAAVAEQVARARGWSLAAVPLRIHRWGAVAPVPPGLPPLPPELAGPDLLGLLDQCLRQPADRRAHGAYYTSPDLALALTTWALEDWPPPPPREGDPPALRVLDPAVGGGAFLLAAARWQAARGADPTAVVAGMSGRDVDPVTVAVAEAALVLWAGDAGADPDRIAVPDVQVADGLDHWPGPPVDLVVGNPPFLGQLSRATARPPAETARLRARFGDAVGPYTDSAALFLVAGCTATRPGGRVALIQPESVLAARDGRGVRAAVGVRADLVGLWVAGASTFAAEVDVCVPVLELRSPRSSPDRPVRRAWGVGMEERPPVPPPSSRSWAPLLASGWGVPEVTLARDGCVGDLATATAGFRQHFYGLVPHLREVGGDVPSPFDPGDRSPGSPPGWAGPEGEPARAGGPPGPLVPLVTVGTVDPLEVLWGRRPTRVAGASWTRPVVDLEGVAADDPEVATWVRARLVPKVLVAPQTRVVEAALDRDGWAVPGVPLVAVEPLAPGERRSALPPDPGRPGRGGDPGGDDGDGGDGEDWALWLLVAALSAPPVSAWALYESAGTARRGDAVKLSAGQVRAVPLPVDGPRWARAAAALRDGAPLGAVGPQLTAAYGLDPDHPVTAWWHGRWAG